MTRIHGGALVCLALLGCADDKDDGNDDSAPSDDSGRDDTATNDDTGGGDDTGTKPQGITARLELVDPANGALLSGGVYAGVAELPNETLDGLGPAMTRAIGDAVTAPLAQWRSTAGALR